MSTSRDEDGAISDAPPFKAIDERFHRQVRDLLADGRSTGDLDADAAIAAHARTYTGRGMHAPIVVGGVSTLDPRSLTARARLLQDISDGRTFAGPEAMALRIEADRLAMFDGARSMGHVSMGGTTEDRIRSKGEYHRLPETMQLAIAADIADGGDIPVNRTAELAREAQKASAQIASGPTGEDAGLAVHGGLGTPIPEIRAGVTGQAESITHRPLSERIASGVMGWARAERAFRHDVSFNVLDEAVRYGLQGETDRAGLTPTDVERVQRAVRDWSAPHLVEGASRKGMDAAVAEAVGGRSPFTGPATRPRGPREAGPAGIPVPQRSGAGR